MYTTRILNAPYPFHGIYIITPLLGRRSVFTSHFQVKSFGVFFVPDIIK